MVYLDNLLNRYNRSVWIGCVGQVFSQLGNFIVYPFLALYLTQKMHIALVQTMEIIALSPIAALVAGYVCGPLSDRYGRKQVMVLALVGQALALLTYTWCSSIASFCIVSILEGFFGAMYFPVVHAFIADVVNKEENLLNEVFSLYHMALNFGGAVGPIIGSLVFSMNPNFVFWVASFSILIAAASIFVFVRNVPVSSKERAEDPKSTSSVKFRDYLIIGAIMFFSLPVALLYAQVKTNLPIHLSHHFKDYLRVYTIMMVFNAICVVVLQMPVTRLTKNTNKRFLIFLSFMAFSIVCIGYAFSPSLPMLLITEFVFTVGEMIGLPQLNGMVAALAPPEKRGHYFAIFDLRWNIGEMIGPTLGALIVTRFSGSTMFVVFGLWIAVSSVLLIGVLDKVMPLKHAKN